MKKVRKYQLKVIVEERIMSDLYSEVTDVCNFSKDAQNDFHLLLDSKIPLDCP